MMVERYALAGTAQEQLLNEKAIKRKNWKDKKSSLRKSKLFEWFTIFL